MKDKVKVRREAVDFFNRSVDPIFWPDRSPDEIAHLRRKGQEFFRAVVRRKPAR